LLLTKLGNTLPRDLEKLSGSHITAQGVDDPID
jgi:hypothetical protein